MQKAENIFTLRLLFCATLSLAWYIDNCVTQCYAKNINDHIAQIEIFILFYKQKLYYLAKKQMNFNELQLSIFQTSRVNFSFPVKK